MASVYKCKYLNVGHHHEALSKFFTIFQTVINAHISIATITRWAIRSPVGDIGALARGNKGSMIVSRPSR